MQGETRGNWQGTRGPDKGLGDLARDKEEGLTRDWDTFHQKI